jgi:phage baseplate assembly protein W
MALVNFPKRQTALSKDLPILQPKSLPNFAIGVTYPFNNPNGVFYQSYTNYDQVLTNLKLLLFTGKGERYLQPEFGTDLKWILFENISNEEEFKEKITGTITSAISRWLVYLNVVSCDVKFNVDENGNPSDNSNVIQISLTVNISGSPSNLPIRIFISDTGNLTIESAIYQQPVGYNG